MPIVPDEARTFGMEGLFRQIGIYSSVGQRYEPQDAGQLMVYREKEDRQLLEEGIVKGMYRFSEGQGNGVRRVRLMGSGTILREAIEAAAMLQTDFGVVC